MLSSASMRPPRNAGENESHALSSLCANAGFNEAPAKCRGKPMRMRVSGLTMSCFNEAPAKCRGKLYQLYYSFGEHGASMRPPRNAGENYYSVFAFDRVRNCFNEAPAKCRGKPQGGLLDLEDVSFASMRPPRNAGENTRWMSGLCLPPVSLQ